MVMLPSFVDRPRQRADPHTRVVAECGNCDACRHHRSNSPFRPKWASQMGYRAFRGTRMATGIERSRRPNARSRGHVAGAACTVYASDFEAPGTSRAFPKVRQRVGKATRQTAAMHPSPWPNGSLWPRTDLSGSLGKLKQACGRRSRASSRTPRCGQRLSRPTQFRRGGRSPPRAG